MGSGWKRCSYAQEIRHSGGEQEDLQRTNITRLDNFRREKGTLENADPRAAPREGTDDMKRRKPQELEWSCFGGHVEKKNKKSGITTNHTAVMARLRWLLVPVSEAPTKTIGLLADAGDMPCHMS